jgi:hypothetical protein
MTEAQARQWFRDIGNVMLQGATITNTPIDDNAIGMFFNALDQDFIWGLLWPVIDDIFTESVLVKGTGALDEACKATMIDPATLIAIVTAIYNLWKMFRK